MIIPHTRGYGKPTLLQMKIIIDHVLNQMPTEHRLPTYVIVDDVWEEVDSTPKIESIERKAKKGK